MLYINIIITASGQAIEYIVRYTNWETVSKYFSWMLFGFIIISFNSGSLPHSSFFSLTNKESEVFKEELKPDFNCLYMLLTCYYFDSELI